MIDRECPELVASRARTSPGRELDELALVREPPEDAPEGAEEVVKAGRAVDRHRKVTPAQRERLQHSRETEVVVRVVMRDEDLPQLDEAHRRLQQLSLRALGAVDEQALAAPANEERSRRPARRRH